MTIAYFRGTNTSKVSPLEAHLNEIVDQVNTGATTDASLVGGAGMCGVIHAAPTTFVKPFMFDDTGTTGGLYVWTGAAYVKVGLATT